MFLYKSLFKNQRTKSLARYFRYLPGFEEGLVVVVVDLVGEPGVSPSGFVVVFTLVVRGARTVLGAPPEPITE